MIQVDISNVWGSLSLPQLLAVEQEIAQAHDKVAGGSGEGSEYLVWRELPGASQEELDRICQRALKIRETSQVCVILGAGGSSLGARAAISLLQGKTRVQGAPELIFAGDSFSTRQWNALTASLEGRDFSIIVISKSGTTAECAIAFRSLRWLLERRCGTDEAAKRITVITDPVCGPLRQLAREENYESFSIPTGVGGRYSVLCAAGLLPMAVAGIDIAAVLRGAQRVTQEYDLRSFENPVWLYAGVRNALHRRGTALELLALCEHGMRGFGLWWQQLFAESEGKDGKGLFPVYMEYTSDLHALGQMIQQGRRNLMETVLLFDTREPEVVIGREARDLEMLNHLSGKTLHFVNLAAARAAIEAHADGGVPVITVDCGVLDEEKVGELFYFFELSCALSAYALGVNPFDQPGVEPYAENFARILGGSEAGEKSISNSQI